MRMLHSPRIHGFLKEGVPAVFLKPSGQVIKDTRGRGGSQGVSGFRMAVTILFAESEPMQSWQRGATVTLEA